MPAGPDLDDRPNPAGSRREAPAWAAAGHRWAAVDVGSNSVHLLVADVDGSDIRPLADESVFLGLGARVDTQGAVGDLLDALVEAIGRYVAVAHDLGAGVVAVVGTEPFRRAVDAGRAVAAVQAGTGIPLHALAHAEEGLLTFLGATGGRMPSGELGVVDIGGGSTELVLAGPVGAPHDAALPLGCARLTRQLGAADPPTPADLASMRSAAESAARALPAAAPLEMIAVGGTASNLAKVAGVWGTDRPLTLRHLEEAVAALASGPAADVAARFGISAGRARSLPAGVAILGAVLARYSLNRARAEEAGLREGLVLALDRAGDAWRDRLRDLAAGRGS